MRAAILPPHPVDTYTRWFTVSRIVDGDTIAGRLDFGFHVGADFLCRLAGMNARELSEPGGPEARDHLATLVPIGAKLAVSSVRTDRYAGRFDGVLWLPSGQSAAAVMIRDGFASAWDGRGSRPVPPWPPVALGQACR